jgi:hypothetical protein
MGVCFVKDPTGICSLLYGETSGLPSRSGLLSLTSDLVPPVSIAFQEPKPYLSVHSITTNTYLPTYT